MKPLRLNQFIDFHYLSNLKTNPSKTWAAFVVKKAHLENNSYDSCIYITDGEQVKALTGLKKESNYFWLDDKHLLFSGNRFSENNDELMTTYYKIAIDGGEAQFAFTLPFVVTRIERFDDQRLIVVAKSDRTQPNFYTYSAKKRTQILKDRKERAFSTTLDELPFWSNGSSYNENQRKRLFIYHLESKALTPITSPGFNLMNLYVDVQQKKLYFSGETYQKKATRREELYVYDVHTTTLTRLLKRQIYSYRGLHVLKNKLLVEATNNQTYGMNQNSKFYLYDVKTDKLLEKSEELLMGNSLGSDVRLGNNARTHVFNHELYYVTTVNDHSELYKVNSDFEIELVYTSTGSIDGFVYLNQQLLTIELLDTPQELYKITKNKRRALTNMNTKQLEETYIAPIKTFTFSSNNDVLNGYVLLPYGYTEDQSYPAILNIHGGPKTAYGPIYYHEMQYWASQGYFVFYTNPHGSSGRSDKFSDIRGKYGSIEYEDLMTLVDEVLKRYPQIDEKRLGVTGGSYGGFMTNWIITHTHRFKAAVTQRSISNWLSFTISDIGYFFAPDQNAADYYSQQGQAKLWDHSPLKYIQQAKTPTLIIHSDKDYRCPIDQGYQLYSALMDLQIPTKMIVFHDENHDLSRSGKPQARIKRLEEITLWMDQYLKK